MNHEDQKEGQDALQPWIEPELEARLTALVLGEASDFEREELERLAAKRPELALYRERLEAVHRMLREVAAEEREGTAGSGDGAKVASRAAGASGRQEWRLSTERRAAVLDRLGGGGERVGGGDGSGACVAESDPVASGAEQMPPARAGRTRWRPLLQFAAAVIFGGVVLALMFPASVGRKPSDAEAWSFQHSEREGASGTGTRVPAPKSEAGIEIVADGPVALGTGGDLSVRRDSDAPEQITVAAIGEGEVALAEGLETRSDESGERGLIAGNVVKRFEERTRQADEAALRGSQLMADRDYQGAIDQYRAALDLLPEAPSTEPRHRAYARQFSQASGTFARERAAEGRYPEALALVEEVLQPSIDPENIDAKRLLEQLSDPDYFSLAMSPAHLERARRIRLALKTAEGYIHLGDYDRADREYHKTLNDDRYHTAARRGQEKNERHRVDYYDQVYNHTRARMIREVTQDWEMPVPAAIDSGSLVDTPTDTITGDIRRNEEKLKTIIIPSVEFADTPLRDALEFLQQRSIELDVNEPDPARKGVSIALDESILASRPAGVGGTSEDAAGPAEEAGFGFDRPAEQGDTRITLRLTNVPLAEALRYTTSLSQLKYQVEDDEVRVVPLSTPISDLYTNVYTVPPNFLGVPGSAGGGAAADPFADPVNAGGGSVGRRSSARDALEAVGISFSSGSAAVYNPATSQLIVRNTPEQMELVESLVDALQSSPRSGAVDGAADGLEQADGSRPQFVTPSAGGEIDLAQSPEVVEFDGFINYGTGVSGVDTSTGPAQASGADRYAQIGHGGASVREIDRSRVRIGGGFSYRNKPDEGNAYSLPGLRVTDEAAESNKFQISTRAGAARSVAEIEIGEPWFRRGADEHPQLGEQIDLQDSTRTHDRVVRRDLLMDGTSSPPLVGTIHMGAGFSQIDNLSGFREVTDVPREEMTPEMGARFDRLSETSGWEIPSPGPRSEVDPSVQSILALTPQAGQVGAASESNLSNLQASSDSTRGLRSSGTHVSQGTIKIEPIDSLLAVVPYVVGGGRAEASGAPPADSTSAALFPSIDDMLMRPGASAPSAHSTLAGGAIETGFDATTWQLAPLPPALEETDAEEEPFSTFSLHVGDASFHFARAELAAGRWPEGERIRIEEFVNAFDYGDPMPATGERVACRLDQAAHPFLQQRQLLRVAMRAAEAGRSGGTPLRLTVLLDSSGSMERPDRRETVLEAFAALAGELGAEDRVTLIGFSRRPRLVADAVPGDRAGELVETVLGLPSEGGTNLEAALALGFEKAREHWLESAQNRVVLLTDGAANLGDASAEGLGNTVAAMRERGLAFDVAGIGIEGSGDEILEALARRGNGRYYLLQRPEDARERFARRLAGALRPAARNVKVQVEFNPGRVASYRLLGYERHRLETEDFRDDRVEAAELAAAEAGVAVYQVRARPEGTGDLGAVSVRFQDMESGEMVERRWPIPFQPAAASPDQADASVLLATVASQFAAKLRSGPLGEVVDLAELARLAAALPEPQRRAARVGQLLEMIEQARGLEGER